MKSITAIAFIIILLPIASCKQMWGGHDLGNNISLLDGDRIEDRCIVLCTGHSDGACIGGINIIPTYSRQMANGKHSEYVELAKSKKNWVIAKTRETKNDKKNY